MATLSISHTTKTFPKLPYQDIANDILPASYSLSLVFVGETKARQYNQQYRNKSYTPNVLSFPLTTSSGEIIICPAVARREAVQHQMTYRGFIGFLFIHGCLHLKGHDHGATMERAEQRICNAYQLR